MMPIIDFRNGRYQGQSKDNLPHGMGMFLDKNLIFIVGEWISGQLQGHTMILFPNGHIYCGQIIQNKPTRLYQCELNEDRVKLIFKNKKAAAVLPSMNNILQIDISDKNDAIILKEHYFRKSQQKQQIISSILALQRKQERQLIYYNNCIKYIQKYLFKPHEDVFQFYISQNRGQKQYFFGLKGQGLGFKISQYSLKNSQISGKVYIIRALGMFTKDNLIKDFNIKTIDSSVRQYLIEQGIFSLPQTIIKYQSGSRPINCAINYINYLKRSLFYRQKILPIKGIQEIVVHMINFNRYIKKPQTQKLAQYTIQNPKIVPYYQQQQIQRQRTLDQETQEQNKIRKTKQILGINYDSKRQFNEFDIQKRKQQVYRSISKKKNGNSANISSFFDQQYVDPDYIKVDNKRQNSNKNVETPKNRGFLAGRLTKSPYKNQSQRRDNAEDIYYKPTHNKYKYIDDDRYKQQNFDEYSYNKNKFRSNTQNPRDKYESRDNLNYNRQNYRQNNNSRNKYNYLYQANNNYKGYR